MMLLEYSAPVLRIAVGARIVDEAAPLFLTAWSVSLGRIAYGTDGVVATRHSGLDFEAHGLRSVRGSFDVASCLRNLSKMLCWLSDNLGVFHAGCDEGSIYSKNASASCPLSDCSKRLLSSQPFQFEVWHHSLKA